MINRLLYSYTTGLGEKTRCLLIQSIRGGQCGLVNYPVNKAQVTVLS
jgi:hypothetical protein